MLTFMTLPDNVLPPVAPYSHAVRAGDFLFVTGQLAEDPTTGQVIKGPIEEQTRRVMDNLALTHPACHQRVWYLTMGAAGLTGW